MIYIVHYSVQYKFQTNVTGTSTMGTVDELSPFTNYSCTVHAVTMTIVGSISDPIVVRTAEAGEMLFNKVFYNILLHTYMTTAPSPPVINAVTAIDSTSVRIEWSMPTNLNGLLTAYTIAYNIEGDNNINRTVNISYNGQPVSTLCIGIYFG